MARRHEIDVYEVDDKGSPKGSRKARAGWLQRRLNGGGRVPVIEGEDGKMYRIRPDGRGRELIEQLIVKDHDAHSP